MLMGIELAERDVSEFKDEIGKLNMSYKDETDNPAYELFLR